MELMTGVGDTKGESSARSGSHSSGQGGEGREWRLLIPLFQDKGIDGGVKNAVKKAVKNDVYPPGRQ